MTRRETDPGDAGSPPAGPAASRAAPTQAWLGLAWLGLVGLGLAGLLGGAVALWGFEGKSIFIETAFAALAACL